MSGVLYLVAGMLLLLGLLWLYIAYAMGNALDWGAAILMLLGSSLVLKPIRRALGNALGFDLEANMALRFMMLCFIAGSLFFYFSSQRAAERHQELRQREQRQQQPTPQTNPQDLYNYSPPRPDTLRQGRATDTLRSN